MCYRVKLNPLSITLSTNYRLMEGAQDFVLKSLFCVVCLQKPLVERAGAAVWNGDGRLLFSCRRVSLGVLVVRRRPWTHSRAVFEAKRGHLGPCRFRSPGAFMG